MTMKNIQCQLCNKKFSKRGINFHIWRMHGEGQSHDPNKNRIAWNKGLTKETDERVAKIGMTFSTRVKEGSIIPSFVGKKHSKETLEKLRKAGGYRHGSGRGKHGSYMGIDCDSSYELAWVIYMIDHKVQFSRCFEKFPYLLDEKVKNYTPDFILEDGTYVEIKGYFDERTQAKIDQFPKNLVVLMKSDLSHIFEYVIKTYGKDFIKLYGLREDMVSSLP